MGKLKGFIRDWTPPALLRAAVGRRSPQNRFSGEYSDWGAAQRASSGYASEIIFEKTRSAALAVKEGRAVFERDSVLFDHVEYPFPMLAGLLRAACENGGDLSVLDFGGSLGTSFRAFDSFRYGAGKLRWSIVDQPRIVECGQREFTNQSLNFYASIRECLERERPQVLLLSSVLQYLERPHEVIQQAKAENFAHIIIDRTPCSYSARDILTVQTVPPSIYEASYPCWIFSRQRLVDALSDQYALLTHVQGERLGRRGDSSQQSWDAFLFDLKDPKGLRHPP